MAVKARGANFDSNHGYWILTDKEYQDYQAKDAQIEALVTAMRKIKKLPPGYGATRERARTIALAAIKEASDG